MFFSVRKILETNPKSLTVTNPTRNFQPEKELFGAENLLDLMLSRVGEFDIDWTDASVFESLLSKKICSTHYSEYFREWRSTKHQPVCGKRTNPKKACTFPESKHNVQATHRLSKEEAKHHLEQNKQFLQPGFG